ncbi:hypothetical protein ACWEV3_15945 [Saccharopolyspora sp. NPDC003752]
MTAWRSMPAAPEGRSAHVNVAGALVLAGGLFLVLFLAGERSLWSRHLAVAVTLAVAAVLLLCVWTVSELRTKTPLVDVRAVRRPAVAGANLAMFVGGSGMYLLLTLVTRYAQTPHGAGYGFGLTTFVAGLVLIDDDQPRPRPPTLTRDQSDHSPIRLIDVVPVGSLTHSAPVMDLSMFLMINSEHRRNRGQGLLGQRLPHHHRP